MTKKVIIIGAGIAGLSAGCYARLNGYDAAIYESHNLPGGLCTAWKRQSYTFDGCIHWLTGSSPANNFYRLWQELGAVQGRRMLNNEVFSRFTGRDGRTFSVYCNADRLEQEMLALSPADAAPTHLLCRLVRRFTGFQTPIGKPFELYGVLDYLPLMLKMLPYLKAMKLCNSLTIGQFAGRFQDPLLRESLPMLLRAKDYPLFSLVVTLSLLHSGDGGFPAGGSLEFAGAIASRYTALGGRLFYRQRVERILVENGRAVGIRLAGGREVRGDYVISAADLRSTLYDLLEGKYLDPQHVEMFRSLNPAKTSVQVSFGVNLDLSGQLEALSESWELPAPLRVGNQQYSWIFVKNYSFDKTLAPPGKSVLESTFEVDDFDYWADLAKDREAYTREKARLAAAVAEAIDRRIPGFQAAVEVIDVATPMTYVRYTGNWKGTYMTWIVPPDQVSRFRLIKKSVPGLTNFWLSGMWVQPPGGLPTGVMTSRDIVQLICRQDKKPFRVEIPPD